MFQVLSNGGKSGSSYGWSIFLDPASNGVGLMIDISTKSHSATLVDLSWSTNSGDIEVTTQYSTMNIIMEKETELLT